MSRTFFLKLFCLLVLLSMLDYTAARRRKRERRGHARLSRRSKNERVVDLQIGDKKRLIRLQRRQLRRAKRRHRRKQMDVGYFSSSDETVGCLEECINEMTDQNCTSRCLEQKETGYSYVKNDKAITVESNDILMDDYTMGDVLRRMKKKPKKGKGRKKSKRTILVPNLVDFENTTGVIKLRIMVDSAFMKTFVNFSDGNIQAAKDEVQYFLELAMIRIVLYYSSLKRLGVNFVTTNNVTFPLDLTVDLENITYPPYNATTKSFYDIPPIALNTRGEGENATLVNNYFSLPNGTVIGTTGVFADLASYTDELFEDITKYDILHVLTGLDLANHQYVMSDTGPVFISSDNGVAGVAFTGAFCRDFKALPFDGRIGIVEFMVPYFDRVIAHELGHNIGARHDGDGRCATSDFTLMTPFALPKVFNMSAQYYNFSICSAEEIASHFSTFTSDEIATCLYTNKPTIDDFLDDYCKGLLGSKYDLNAHCKIFFSKDSYVCPEGNTDLAKGYVANDKCQPVLDEFFNFPPLWKCASNNQCDNTTNMIFHLFDGSKCLDPDGAQGNQVCFNGECLSNFELCSKRSTGKDKSKKKDKKGKGKKKDKKGKGKKGKKGKGKKDKKGKSKKKDRNRKKKTNRDRKKKNTGKRASRSGRRKR